MRSQTEPSTLPAASGRPAHLSIDPARDVLEVVEFGAVWDGQPAALARGIAAEERIGFLLEEPAGSVIGFAALEPHAIDLDALDAAEVWDGPRFAVPALGLDDACAGEILLAVQGRYDPGEPTVDAMYFGLAVAAQHDDETDAETVAELYRMALEAGQQRARFALGYVLLEAGRPRDAYDHLRRYAEQAPSNSWAWRWLGAAAEAIGEVKEALRAYKRAELCQAKGSFETDAAELAAALRERRRGS